MSRQLLKRIAVISLIALLLGACDSDRLNRLRIGVTTSEEVRSIMGPPTSEWRDEDGSRTWEYPRTPEGLVNYMLVIGADDRLREIRQVLSEENFARVRPGMNREEVRRLLGQPAHEQWFPLQQETVWDWKTRVEPGMVWYFNVHFDSRGLVTRTSTNFVPRGG